MSLTEKLLMPKKLMIAGLVMIAIRILCIALQYYFDIQTVKLVKTVFYYLVLDYIWTSIRREFFPDRS
jgi:hypothetical protein